MTKPINPLLKAENRAILIHRCMARIDDIQSKVIEEANKQIPNLTEFENNAYQKLESYKEKKTHNI